MLQKIIEGTGWNQKGIKIEPKGEQNVSKSVPKKDIPINLENEGLGYHLIDLGFHFGSALDFEGVP